MKKAVIITAAGVQDEEFVYPYYRLLEEGFHDDVATQAETVVTTINMVTVKASILKAQFTEKVPDSIQLKIFIFSVFSPLR